MFKFLSFFFNAWSVILNVVSLCLVSHNRVDVQVSFVLQCLLRLHHTRRALFFFWIECHPYRLGYESQAFVSVKPSAFLYTEARVFGCVSVCHPHNSYNSHTSSAINAQVIRPKALLWWHHFALFGRHLQSHDLQNNNLFFNVKGTCGSIGVPNITRYSL